jgi:hypothetical protein
LSLAREFEVGHRRLVVFDLAVLVLAIAIHSHLLSLSLAISMTFALRVPAVAL